MRKFGIVIENFPSSRPWTHESTSDAATALLATFLVGALASDAPALAMLDQVLPFGLQL
jgi:hypothetical protein